MSIETYLAFVLAGLALAITPGPDMILQLSRTIAQGRRAGLYTALGINAGIYVHMIFSIFGISAILATSSLAFAIVKYVGAAYLIYLGVQALRSKEGLVKLGATPAKAVSAKALFRQGLLCNVLNPKVALFFLAFLPQFVSAQDPNPIVTLAILGITFSMIGVGISIVLIYAAAGISVGLRKNVRISAVLNKAMGLVFVALGFRLATEKV